VEGVEEWSGGDSGGTIRVIERRRYYIFSVYSSIPPLKIWCGGRKAEVLFEFHSQEISEK